MMDAGVPITSAVAGIAMGMIAEGGKIAILTDILGDEDALGDMDFKVTGTENGITACQMDIKVDGLSYEVLVEALHQAKRGRLHILGEMEKTISEPKAELKPHTPRINVVMIPREFIGAIIGPGGKIIQEMQREFETTITIEEIGDQGKIEIMGSNKERMDGVLAKIKGIVAIPEVGEIYKGKVRSIQAYGAFVEFMPGKDGLLHISEVDHKRLDSLEGVIKEGDVFDVQLIGLDKKTGKFKLSRKSLMPKPEGTKTPEANTTTQN
jgi:polyribonucleotide nucleotidyltransferase